jgi:hypothetical protein
VQIDLREGNRGHTSLHFFRKKFFPEGRSAMGPPMPRNPFSALAFHAIAKMKWCCPHNIFC